HKLWKEFSAACDKAYEPCREIFKAQKVERKDNLNKKRALITEIETRFADTDWKQPNWKELDKWLRQQRSAFYNIGHTEHKHHKTLKTRLDKITDEFEIHLGRERARSLKARQTLITDIEALAELEDARAAMTQLETLKKSWVITVLEKRGIENKLWDAYQKAQDAIYNKRNADRKEQDQVRNDNLKQKRLVVEALIQAANAPAEELLKQQSALAQHGDQFNAIGYVPRKAEKALMDSWRKAQKDFKSALSKAKKSLAKAEMQAIIDKAKLCAELENQLQLSKTIDTEKAKATFEALPALSSAAETAMNKRFESIITGKAIDAKTLQDNTEAQLSRCLKIEVMLDLDTPNEFSKARMAYQIERLSASMKKNTSGQESKDSLLDELLLCSAVDPKQSTTLWKRIDAILAA
ncbi:MAG: DUF349 domain-containing protein, partial [Arenicellales bacterium]